MSSSSCLCDAPVQNLVYLGQLGPNVMTLKWVEDCRDKSPCVSTLLQNEITPPAALQDWYGRSSSLPAGDRMGQRKYYVNCHPSDQPE